MDQFSVPSSGSQCPGLHSFFHPPRAHSNSPLRLRVFCVGVRWRFPATGYWVYEKVRAMV